MSRYRVLLAVGGLVVAGLTLSAFAGFRLPNLLPFRDPSGVFRTLALSPVELSNPFFEKLGTNDRSCSTCHDAGEGWSITPPQLQQRFQITQGKDPIFRPVDGANCPSDDVSTGQARSTSYSLLLNKGLIRMSLPVPSNADFGIISIDDPYSCPETTTSVRPGSSSWKIGPYSRASLMISCVCVSPSRSSKFPNRNLAGGCGIGSK